MSWQGQAKIGLRSNNYSGWKWLAKMYCNQRRPEFISNWKDKNILRLWDGASQSRDVNHQRRQKVSVSSHHRYIAPPSSIYFSQIQQHHHFNIYIFEIVLQFRRDWLKWNFWVFFRFDGSSGPICHQNLYTSRQFSDSCHHFCFEGIR